MLGILKAEYMRHKASETSMAYNVNKLNEKKRVSNHFIFPTKPAALIRKTTSRPRSKTLRLCALATEGGGTGGIDEGRKWGHLLAVILQIFVFTGCWRPASICTSDYYFYTLAYLSQLCVRLWISWMILRTLSYSTHWLFFVGGYFSYWWLWYLEW